MTFTGLIGKICMFPLRAIIDACVALRIHPNILTFVGLLINNHINNFFVNTALI